MLRKMDDMVTLFKYACSIHIGAGQLFFQIVDLQEMEIIKRPVGDRKSGEKPVVFEDGPFITYKDLTQHGRYQMWVGQEWEDAEDSLDMKVVRSNLMKRISLISTYDESDEVCIAQAQAVVKVPYDYVMTYLAQRTGYSVTPKDRQENIQSENEADHQKTSEHLMEVEKGIKRGADSSVVSSEHKRQRSSTHQASESTLREIIDDIVSSDLTLISEFKKSIGSIHRLANTLKDEIGKII